MSNYMTPEDAARTMVCPMHNGFRMAPKDGMCRGETCPVWRWKPRLNTDPEFKSAIIREMHLLAQEKSEVTGKKHDHSAFHKEAVARVMRNPEGYGIKREEGFCGLGGPIT